MAYNLSIHIRLNRKQTVNIFFSYEKSDKILSHYYLSTYWHNLAKWLSCQTNKASKSNSESDRLLNLISYVETCVINITNNELHITALSALFAYSTFSHHPKLLPNWNRNIEKYGWLQTVVGLCEICLMTDAKNRCRPGHKFHHRVGIQLIKFKEY